MQRGVPGSDVCAVSCSLIGGAPQEETSTGPTLWHSLKEDIRTLVHFNVDADSSGNMDSYSVCLIEGGCGCTVYM